jgi:lipopolysaccharide transport system permease protein
VWFPREIIPLAPVMAGLVDLAAASVILVPIILVQGVGFSVHAITAPLVLYVAIVWVAAIAVIGATITIFFRDLATIIGLGLRLAFIATPVMYSAEVVPPQFGWVLAANPFAVVVNNMRNVLLAHVWPNWNLLGLHALIGTVLFLVGIKYLRSVERRMVDII